MFELALRIATTTALAWIAARPPHCAHAQAEAPHPDRLVVLRPVVVTATRLPEALGDVPASISVVEGADIRGAGPTVSIEEPLRRVPGVFAQDSGNFADDVRIQIRGFGTRAAFGIREIRVLVDGLPETLPDGQTQVDGIDLGAIGRMEVLRGPASSLYGNASGGVIQLFTDDGSETPWGEVALRGGSHGLQKYQIRGGGSGGNARMSLHASFLQLDGFRDHSAARKLTANGKLRYRLSDRTEITAVANAVEAPRADNPGGLTREELDRDPARARDLNLRLHAGEEVRQSRVGITAQHRADRGDISAYAYTLYRDLDNRLPILPDAGDGIVALRRFGAGAGTRYTLRAAVLGRPQTLTAGIDLQHQNDARRRFANLDGQRGRMGLHQDERVTSVGPYVREAVYVRDDLEVSAGVRYDTIHFATDVRTPADSGDSGSRTLDAWSPAGSVRHSPQPWLNLFGTVATAFQVPTTTEFANPTGAGFNQALRPQTAVSYEGGARLEFLGRLEAEIAAFRLDIEDELLPFESESGRTFFRNAGRSRRYGLETGWTAFVHPALRWSGAATLMYAEFREYQTAAGDMAGNREPGIPPWQLYQELLYRHGDGAYAALEVAAAGSYFVDDENTVRAPGYATLNLRAGYEHTAGRWTIGPVVGLNNLTDATYAGAVRLNARGGRFFEPAPGFNLYGGLTAVARL